MWMVDFTDKYDWDFLGKVLAEYKGTWIFLAAYVAMVLIYLLQKNRQLREIFVYPFLIQLLTVYNIFILDPLIPKLGLTTRYYRFLWILPVVPVIGIFSVWLLQKVTYKAAKPVLFCFITAGIIAVGFNHRILQTEGWPSNMKLENSYKVPDEIIEVSALLHSEGVKDPVVIYGYQEILLMRGYDASIISPIGREDIINLRPYTLEEVNQVFDSDRYAEQLKLYAIYGHQMERAVFEKAVKALEVDYMVLEKDSNISSYTKHLGYECIGETHGRSVYRIGEGKEKIGKKDKE